MEEANTWEEWFRWGKHLTDNNKDNTKDNPRERGGRFEKRAAASIGVFNRFWK